MSVNYKSNRTLQNLTLSFSEVTMKIANPLCDLFCGTIHHTEALIILNVAIMQQEN